MADNDESETACTNDWEVLSLTASTYAAASGPAEVEPKDNDVGNVIEQDEAETSHALFMSHHFVFPPSKHLEPDRNKIHEVSRGEDVVSDAAIDEGVQPSGKNEENLPIPGLNVLEEFSDLQYLDEKIRKLSDHRKIFDEGSTLIGFGSVNEKESIYDTAKYSSLHDEMALDRANQYGDNLVVSETAESADQDSSGSSDLSRSKDFLEESRDVPVNLPCRAWWKRRAASLYAHSKETSAFWSIFIATAVMGLVMLGHRWRQESAFQLERQIGKEQGSQSDLSS